MGGGLAFAAFSAAIDLYIRKEPAEWVSAQVLSSSRGLTTMWSDSQRGLACPSNKPAIYLTTIDHDCPTLYRLAICIAPSPLHSPAARQ